MSDMYLVLRERLEDVASWVTLGVDTIRKAQQASGLSDERLARQIPVSTRTWIRWRERGQVPMHTLDRVADLLELELERPQRLKVMLEDPPDDDRLAEVEARLSEVVSVLERLADRVDQLADGQATARVQQ